MTALLVLWLVVSTVHAGTAKYYSPGMFKRVAANRGIVLRQDVAGYASTPYCSNIGKIIIASVNGHPAEYYQVVDCSNPAPPCKGCESDQHRHLRQGLVIEIDYASARRTGILGDGRGPAIVLYP